MRANVMWPATVLLVVRLVETASEIAHQQIQQHAGSPDDHLHPPPKHSRIELVPVFQAGDRDESGFPINTFRCAALLASVN